MLVHLSIVKRFELSPRFASVGFEPTTRSPHNCLYYTIFKMLSILFLLLSIFLRAGYSRAIFPCLFVIACPFLLFGWVIGVVYNVRNSYEA